MVMVDMHGIDHAFTGIRDEPLYGRVKEFLRGGDRWPWVLTRLGIPDSALKGKNCPCPGCGGKDRFRFDNKDGTGSFLCSQGTGNVLAGSGWALLEHVYGWSFERALDEVARVALVDFAPKAGIGTSSSGHVHMAPSELPQAVSMPVAPGVPQVIHWQNLAEEPQRRYDYLMRVFRESIPLSQLDGTALQIVRNYWISRGMGATFRMPPHLHFHARLTDTQQQWSGPALIAWITRPCDGPNAFADRHFVGMQRIWLNPALLHGPLPAKQSKAPIEQAKKSFGIMDKGMIGSSVHLYGSEKSRVRLIGEGIETVLSWLRLQSLQGTLTESVEAHACLGTSQIKNWFAPTDKPVWLLQDNDPAGKDAAALFQKLHPDTRILAPPSSCNDFNDYLLAMIQKPSSQRSISPCVP
ncbi:primase-helicase zinc-binding domain-containing protein [Acidithiobacillus sp. M4-SHS-6]|uniref:primase-helicase zinc-binding domain-containing protein n=1 Tax=Acidithiobacillus sp. M4-SHS-6 TaxID=3383024 RepID=UPI0039BE7DCF